MKHPSRVMMQVQVNAEFLSAVKNAADREMITISGLVRRVMLNHLRTLGIDPISPLPGEMSLAETWELAKARRARNG